MSVIIASHCKFAPLATLTRVLAKSLAICIVELNDPFPTFTSNTNDLMPEAIFLDNIDSVLKNKLSGADDILSTKILLICRSGKRSGEAAEILEAAGYKNIFNIVDALLIRKIFLLLEANNIFVMTSSNFKPDDLYKNGLQRSDFIPFIKNIKEKSKKK